MSNAKKEFLGLIQGVSSKVKCATITHGNPWYDEDESRKIILPVGYTPYEWDTFINSLDFEYDDGYGGQELFGTIWFENGTWAERGEYDGSEWWEYKSCPSIPEHLNVK